MVRSLGFWHVPKYTKEEEAGGSLSKKQAIGKATGRFCTRCGAILDVQTGVGMQDEIESLDEKFSTPLQDEEVQKLLMRRMIEFGIELVDWRKEHILQTLLGVKGLGSAGFDSG